MVIRAIEELNFLKGAGAREAARHSWVQAQEEVNSRGACREEKDQPIQDSSQLNSMSLKEVRKYSLVGCKIPFSQSKGGERKPERGPGWVSTFHPPPYQNRL